MNLTDLHNHLWVEKDDKILYRILKDYSGTYIDEVLKKEERLIEPFFRVFEPAKPNKNRKWQGRK